MQPIPCSPLQRATDHLDIILSEEEHTALKRIGDRLRFGRQRLGWTQVDLAHRSGIGVATVRRIELGTVTPHPTSVRKLAEALEVRVPWLAIGEEPMQEKTSNAREG